MTALLEIGSSEEVALFNPAFLARLLHAAASDYKSTAQVGMPAPLAFLLLPLVLHKPTRDDLPMLATVQMQKWIREHPQHLAGLDARVRAMRPFVGLAVRFGLRHALLESSDGGISAGSVKRRPAGFATSNRQKWTIAAASRSCLVVGSHVNLTRLRCLRFGD